MQNLKLPSFELVSWVKRAMAGVGPLAKPTGSAPAASQEGKHTGHAFLFLFPVLIFFGCTHQQPSTTLHIGLTDSNRSLKISGINPVILNDINRDTVKNWQSLFAIYRLPADTDAKDYQPIQPGQYHLKDSAIVFTPDTPFTKRQTYFMRYYNYAGNKSIWDYVRGKTTKGQLHYIDLIFKQ